MACKADGGKHSWRPYRSSIPGAPKRKICAKCAKIEDEASTLVVLISSLIALGIIALIAYYFGLFDAPK